MALIALSGAVVGRACPGPAGPRRLRPAPGDVFSPPARATQGSSTWRRSGAGDGERSAERVPAVPAPAAKIAPAGRRHRQHRRIPGSFPVLVLERSRRTVRVGRCETHDDPGTLLRRPADSECRGQVGRGGAGLDRVELDARPGLGVLDREHGGCGLRRGAERQRQVDPGQPHASRGEPGGAAGPVIRSGRQGPAKGFPPRGRRNPHLTMHHKPASGIDRGRN